MYHVGYLGIRVFERMGGYLLDLDTCNPVPDLCLIIEWIAVAALIVGR